MGRRAVYPACLLAAGALLVAGCGGSSEESATTQWADGLCSALTTWTSSVSSVGDTLKQGDLSKDSLKTAADEVTGATSTLADDLKGLGKPDTEAGQQAKDSLDQLAGELETDVKQIEGEVDDVSGVSGVTSALSAVTKTLTTMGSQVSSTFTELENLDAKGELEDAFQQASSCDELTQSG